MKPSATVRDLLDRTGRHLLAVIPGAPLIECVRVMVEQGVGSLVVLEHGDVVGIATWHDVLRQIAADPERFADATAADVMSKQVQVAREEDDLDETRARMLEKNIRHLPVMRGGELLGVVTLLDVLVLELERAEGMSDEIAAYVSGAYF